MAYNYRYLLTDLTANPSIIGELQFTNASWSQVLNSPGDFTGQININDDRLVQTVGTYGGPFVSSLLNTTQPGSVGLYVERNGVLVWGGIVWSRSWDSAAQLLTITAKTFDSYFERRIVKDFIGNTGSLTFDAGTDQFAVMTGTNAVLDNMKAEYDIGITYTSTFTSGVGIPGQLCFNDYEHRKVSQVLQDLLAQSTNTDSQTGQVTNSGFDYAVDVSYSPAKALQRIFTMYYPSKGVTDPTLPTAPTLYFPSGALGYTWSEDGWSMATSLTGVGSGSGCGQYSVTRTPNPAKTGLTISQYPLLEDVASFTQVFETGAVDSLTQARADAVGAPIATPQFVWFPGSQTASDVLLGSGAVGTPVDIPSGPEIGTFATGDLFNLRIDDNYFYGGVSRVMRLVKFEVSVGDGGTVEMVTGDFTLPTY